MKSAIENARNGSQYSAASRLVEAVGCTAVIAVLLDEPLPSLALERSLGGPQPGFWEQPPDAPGLADEARSGVEPLLPV